MKSDGKKTVKKTVKKRRVYQVAREFSISNETLIEFLQENKFKVRNHMVPIDDKMYETICQNFKVEEVEGDRESDYRKRIQEKKEEEEARYQAVRHEIDEILERSKGTYEPIEVVHGKDFDEELIVKPGKTTRKKGKSVPEKKAEDKAGKKKTDLKKDRKKGDLTEEEVKVSKPGVPKTEKDEKESSEKAKRHLKRRPKVEKKAEAAEEDKTPDKKRRRKKGKVETTDGAAELGEHVGTKKKRKRKRKKTGVKIDEKEIKAAIKDTMAKMTETPKRKKKKKDKEVEELDIETGNIIQTTEFTSVAELANLMDVDPSEVIKACLSLGLLVSINQRLDRDTILMVADEFEFDVKFQTEYGEERIEEFEEEDDESQLEPRPPVVTIMGHVDHGKTSLLDYIRESNIIAGESGGITQHIGAYEVVFGKKQITFLDTPGHEAFTAMRARGAQVTDIVVLVVAADDSVMPQTIEAINHARAAAVPILVAINKIDKSNANVDQIKKQLSENNVLVEDWGGKIQCAAISAKTGEGIDHLLEIILLEAEVLELKANPSAHARGVLVEAKMDRGKGVIGTVLVKRGTLRIGEAFVAGQFNGRVRAMFDERGHAVKEAPPSTPVQLLGFTGMPQAGDLLIQVDTEQEAKEIGLKRQQLKREQGFRQVRRLTLDQISQRIAEGTVKELSIIIKADVDGSLEALSDSLMSMGTDDVAVRIILKGVGNITESDVMLAVASQAVIIGFHVEPIAQAKELAINEKIDIRLYKVIYDAVNDIKLALSGLLEPEIHEESLGSVEVREVFKASRIGLIAGCYVLTGKIVRNSMVRLKRNDEIVYEGKIESLKRFKDDVKEVASGYECGIVLDNFKDIQVGDVLETYRLIETARTL